MASTLVVAELALPAIVIHGGAGAYLKTTSAEARRERGETLLAIATRAWQVLRAEGARAAVLDAVAALERDPGFNAGYGSRLQRDGEARLSAALMDGARTRLSAVYNVERCLHPSQLAAALQARADRNLDGRGASLLMQELGVAETDVRSPRSIERWQRLAAGGEHADGEAAIGSAGADAVEAAKRAGLPLPPDLRDRYGTVGAVACGADGDIWACTSTGGRGHEAVGRVSDTPTPAATYACPRVALSATGFGEQILDLNVCGRIATRLLDGATLAAALARTMDEVAALEGLLGVIAVTPEGVAGYAHTTEACGVAWVDAGGQTHVDQHGR
jgi:L-asparaginase